MKTKKFIFGFSILATVFLAFGFFAYTITHTYHKSLPFSDERELKVTLEAGYGSVNISKGEHTSILNATIQTDNEQDLTQFIDYSKKGGIGYLSINVNNDGERRGEDKKRTINFDGFESNNWTMNFTDAVPISFDIELGLGKGNFDFTGIKVKDLNLSAGASSVDIRFDKPNKSVIEDLTIESGLSKFHADNLCNANFNHLKFEGGVGSYKLDFGGELKKEVDVDIEVGLGSLTIIIPNNVGARIMYEKNWISHIDLDSNIDEREENNYYTSNYYSAKGKINMRVEAGFGSVKIKRQ